MGIEIERRFIVRGDKWRNAADKYEHFKQGYLESNPNGWTVRVRLINNKNSYLTLKSLYKGIANHEYEYEIPYSDGLSLLKLCNFKIIKKRYSIEFQKNNWVIDEFEANNSPLVIAEIELKNENQTIQIPSWCDEEITGEKNWSNSCLAIHPISNWPIENRLKKIGPR
tara:strand:- start:329 stop:832 length:504 start_codon:yes stop_codon:yes gene_type:complete